MNKLQLRGMFLAATLAASAAEAEGQQWSIVGPRTVEPKANAVEVGAGWPGVWVAYLRGIASGVNLGAKATFAYGVEGTVRSVVPGVRVQALLKARLLDTDRVSLGLVFEPGPFVYGPHYGSARVGFALPVGLRVGIATSSAFALSVLFDVPMWVEFGVGGGFNVPILTGVGVEYFATSDVGIFARVAVGPTIGPNGRAEFTLDATLGAGFHF